MTISPIAKTVALLAVSNLFMVYAWYGHLKNLSGRPILMVIFISWGVALLEYLFMIPANRIGFGAMSLTQLKLLQEAVHLIIFALFAYFYMKQSFRLDHLWALLCLMGAVYFVFRQPG